MAKFRLLLLLFCLAACSPSDLGKYFSFASETNVLAVLKQTESMQAAHLMEREKFAATLAALKSAGFSSRQMDDVAAAQARGKSIYGYVFRDIVNNEYGGALNNSVRYGMLAVPEKPGAGPSFLLLINLASGTINEEGPSTGIGAEWYKSSSATLTGDNWPRLAELSAWEKMQRYSPKESAAKAKAKAEER